MESFFTASASKNLDHVSFPYFTGKELYNLPVEEHAFVVLEEDGTEVVDSKTPSLIKIKDVSTNIVNN